MYLVGWQRAAPFLPYVLGGCGGGGRAPDLCAVSPETKRFAKSDETLLRQFILCNVGIRVYINKICINQLQKQPRRWRVNPVLAGVSSHLPLAGRGGAPDATSV